MISHRSRGSLGDALNQYPGLPIASNAALSKFPAIQDIQPDDSALQPPLMTAPPAAAGSAKALVTSRFVPKPAITIISSDSEARADHRNTSPIPPPLPVRPGQGAEPSSIPPVDGIQSAAITSGLPATDQSSIAERGAAMAITAERHSAIRSLEWEEKGKVKEGYRRIWDEDQARWVDIPVAGAQGGGPGSSRTWVRLGMGGVV
ncbi:hypothetical protein IAU60_006865 [Kwoniella sp. DSM 27419]